MWLHARMHINNSLLGSPVLIPSLAPERFPPSEKPLLGASHISCGTRGAGSGPPSRAVITSVSPELKKAQIS